MKTSQNIDKHSDEIIKQWIKDNPDFTGLELWEKLNDVFTTRDNIDHIIKELGTPPSRSEFVKKLQNTKNGYQTGYTLNGQDDPITFQSGAITIISAPTKHGKTTALFNFFLNIAEQYKEKTHYFFSYEESETSLIPKMASRYIDLDLSKDNFKSLKHFYKKGSHKFISKDVEKSYLMTLDSEFWESIENCRIIYQNHSLSKLADMIDRLGKNKDTGVIFIDYLQLIPIDGQWNRHEAIKELCNTMKDRAVSNDITLVMASQFNRETRTPDDLIVQNLSEGSDIEKAANQIIGLWHFGKVATYGNNSNGKEFKEYTESYNKNHVLIKILANRDGEGNIHSIFECDYNKKRIYNDSLRSPDRVRSSTPKKSEFPNPKELTKSDPWILPQ